MLAVAWKDERARAAGLVKTVITVRTAAGVARLVLAGVEIAALVGNFGYVLGFATFATANFFSYFTIQSAVAAVVMFAAAAVAAFRLPEDPAWLDTYRAMVTTYLIVSGTIFAIIVIQSSTHDYTIAVPISDQVLHFWMPPLALVDWLVDSRKTRLSWKYLAWVLVYPVVWGVFTLIRGALVRWYPYFFLDAKQVTPFETAFYCTVCLAVVVGIAAMLMVMARLRHALWGRRTVD